jgi:TonB family protein
MRARFLSLMIHAAAIALLIAISSRPIPRHFLSAMAILVDPSPHSLMPPYVAHGGGGGGERSLLSASRGRLPKRARRQFTPPSATPPKVQAVLVMEPALVAPPDLGLLQQALLRIGDPFGRDGPASSGPGSGGGIGSGSGGGIGARKGPGSGSDDGGGISAAGIGGSITAPAVLYRVDPEFSEEARKAKYQGTVVLTLEVGEDGKPRGFRIVRGLGLGLDQKALEAVAQWKFRPAMRNGRPVRAPATIEVNFRLL